MSIVGEILQLCETSISRDAFLHFELSAASSEPRGKEYYYRYLLIRDRIVLTANAAQ